MLISHLTLLLLPLLPGLSTAAGSRGPARAPAAPGIQWACAGPGLACAGGAPEEEKPAEEAGESEAPAAPALRRVAVIGASASDGFGLAVKLPAAFESLVRGGHEPLLGLGDSMFFTRPRSTAEQQVEEAVQQGADEDEVRKQVEESRAEFASAADQRLKSYFLIRRIAQQEEIKVTKNEMTQALRAISRHHGVDVKTVEKVYKEQGRLDDVASDILTGKVRAFLMKKVEEKHGAVEGETAEA